MGEAHGPGLIAWKAIYLEEIQHFLGDGIWSVQNDVVDVLKIDEKRHKHNRGLNRGSA